MDLCKVSRLEVARLEPMQERQIKFLKLRIMKLKLDWFCKQRIHCGVISELLVCMRAIRTKLGNEAHWGPEVSLPLSSDHLGSRIGISLTCDYSVLHSHHGDDSLNMLQVEGCGWDKEGAANSFLPLPMPHWEWMEMKMGKRASGGGGVAVKRARGGVISLLFKRLRVRSTMIPPGPLTWQPCLSSIKANGCN